MKYSIPVLDLSPPEPVKETQLEIEGLSVKLGDSLILQDINLTVEKGQIGCLVGPSGCGKTTLLRTIAGFEQPCHGSIRLADRAVADTQASAMPEARGVGMVFQDLALFPHLNVARNIGFGLDKLSAKEREARVTELLELVGMSRYADNFPHQLSGGQQQRVALIRSMAPRPDLLLLDEPFSSQDTELRVKLAHEVRDLLKRDNTTAILVTHDQNEAFAIADSIGVMSDGLLRQWNNAYELYHRPADRFVADFIGEGVFICGNTLSPERVQTELGIIEGDLSTEFDVGTQIELLVRPDDIEHDETSPNKGTVVAKDFRGANHLYTLSMPTRTRVLCLVPSHYNHNIGDSIGVKLKMDHLVLFEDRFGG